MTAPRRRLIVKELREQFHVLLTSAGLGRWTWPAPASATHPSFAMNRRRWLDGSRNWPGRTPRYGYRRIWALLDREGWSVNKKAVRRIWRQSGLKLAQPQAVPDKPRRPHGQDRNACHLRPSRGKDDVWTWDFIFDRTSDGRSLKWLSLVDEYTRECLALEAQRDEA